MAVPIRPLVRKMDAPRINEAVRSGLAHEWAPEQIAGRLKQQQRRVSSPTIYAWIKQDEHRPHRGIDVASSRQTSLPTEASVLVYLSVNVMLI